MRTAHFVLEAEPDELAGAVDVEALLVDVVAALTAPAPWWVPWRRPWSADTLAIVQDRLRDRPCRILQRSSAQIDQMAQASAITTGLPGACMARGLCFGPGLVVIIRLDWRTLVAHELTHVCQHLMWRPLSEWEASRMADAVG